MRTVAAAGGVCVLVVALVIVALTLHGPGEPAATPAAGATTRGRSGGSRPDPFGSAGSYVRGRDGTVTAAVYDMRTGQTWAFGSARPQAEASVVKLGILETLLDRDPGGLPAADRPLATQMIEDSDNDAATSLWYAAAGAAGVGAYDSAAGLGDTTPSPCVRCAGFAWPGWGLSTTTPADQLRLLRQLAGPGTLLSAGDRAYALSLLENVTAGQRWGVSGGVPAGVTVALKNGWLPLDAAATDWQINSVGWVSGQGRDYLMAVLATGNPSERYGIDTINELSSLVWHALG
ncbi:MAG TPA: serine hydrolase [Trebonia sp.]|nr:serine hydrolase [Trebonia sp.]